MQVTHSHCAGIDVHKKTGVAEGRYELLRDWNIPEFKVVE
jgi:hypothetical protein